MKTFALSVVMLLANSSSALASCVTIQACQAALAAAQAPVTALQPIQDQLQARYHSDIDHVQALAWGDPARHDAQADAGATMTKIKQRARERKKLDQAVAAATHDTDRLRREAITKNFAKH